ncbi:MAG: DMT family transporter [Desulfovibrio sp.]|nr:DMT family transporter [Desulfovibrio sp.]
MTYIALVFLAGCMAALQPPINAALGRTVGVLESGLISFAGGTAALALLVLWRGQGSLARVADTPAWQWVGGLLGACMVSGWWSRLEEKRENRMKIENWNATPERLAMTKREY